MVDLIKASDDLSLVGRSIHRTLSVRVLNAIKEGVDVTSHDILLALNLPMFDHYKASINEVTRTLVKEERICRCNGRFRIIQK